jgi:hypothetical protein
LAPLRDFKLPLPGKLRSNLANLRHQCTPRGFRSGQGTCHL